MTNKLLATCLLSGKATSSNTISGCCALASVSACTNVALCCKRGYRLRGSESRPNFRAGTADDTANVSALTVMQSAAPLLMALNGVPAAPGTTSTGSVMPDGGTAYSGHSEITLAHPFSEIEHYRITDDGQMSLDAARN